MLRARQVGKGVGVLGESIRGTLGSLSWASRPRCRREVGGFTLDSGLGIQRWRMRRTRRWGALTPGNGSREETALDLLGNLGPCVGSATW